MYQLYRNHVPLQSSSRRARSLGGLTHPRHVPVQNLEKGPTCSVSARCPVLVFPPLSIIRSPLMCPFSSSLHLFILNISILRCSPLPYLTSSAHSRGRT